MKKSVLSAVIILLASICLCGCSSTTTQNKQSSYSNNVATQPKSACSQSLLHQFANTEEDLLITHEMTGVIVGRAEYAGKYVIKVDKSLWNQTTAEQRVLIRCSTETIGKQKGLEGVVLDPTKNEQLN